MEFFKPSLHDHGNVQQIDTKRCKHQNDIILAERATTSICLLLHDKQKQPATPSGRGYSK
jgi:hypothetical protein